MHFAGQVAMVTGAGRGIGAATAELLARQGATVAILDLEEAVCQETAAAITAAGGQALPIPCDVTDRAQVERAVQTIIERFGRLDILVACAGITRDNLIHKLTDADWDGVMETHLKGSFLAVQAAQRPMVTQRSGKIVLLSST
jgi:3-oxoacyl-[acyl-carrier protein] reductase